MKPLLIAGIAFVLCAPAASADTARQILDQVIAINRAREPKDVKQILHMTNLVGEDVLFARELQVETKLYGNDKAKTVTFFFSPNDIKGVGFLAWTDPHETDVQWLYLPKLHRVRQIGPSARRQSFQDTVFTYEDLELFAEMSKWTEDDAASRLLDGAETMDSIPCAVIELVPKRADVSYGRFVVWVDRGDSTVRKSDLYDRSDEALIKTASFTKFQTIDGIPTAHRMEFANVRTRLKTVLEVSETKYNQGLDEEIFTPSHLERASP